MSSHEWSQRIDDEALTWFLKHHDHIDARSALAFKAWLSIDPAHERAYQRWQHDWDSLDNLDAIQLASLGLSHDSVDGLLTKSTRSWWQITKDAWADFLLMPSRRHFALLGVLCLIIGVGGLGIYGRGLDQPQFVVRYVTQPGEQKTIVLPDQSTLVLDTDTRMRVSLYPHQRAFVLEYGQAVLNVHLDHERPALVSLAQGWQLDTVQAQVEMRQLDPQYYQAQKMTMLTGNGQLRMPASSRWFWRTSQGTQSLTAGQQVLIEHSAAQSSSDPLATWRGGILSFQQASLAQIVAEFNRYRPLVVLFSNDELARLSLSGSFALDQPERFIEQLPSLLPLRIRADANTYIISP